MKTNRSGLLVAMVLSCVLAACSEAAGGDDDGLSGTAGDSGASGAAGQAGTSGANGASGAGNAGAAGENGAAGNAGHAGNPGGASGDSGSAGAAGNAATGLVINEISADKSDFAELFNSGSVTLSLAGYKVADIDGTTGEPKLSDAATIPDDVTLAPGAYLIIDANNSAPKDGIQEDCPESGASMCLQAAFGLSAGDGDTVFVIDPAGHVVAQASIPANGAPKPASWCRLPNGTGDFALCASTPGAENAAP